MSAIKQICPICNKNSTFDDSILGNMVECPECNNLFVLTESELSYVQCPECSSKVESGKRICLECGYNFDTFKHVEEHIPLYGEEFSWPRKVLAFVAEMVPGLFIIHILFLFIASIFTALFIFYFGLILLGFGAIVTMIFFAVCAFFVYAHGVGFLLTGEVQSLKNAMAELTGKKWNLFLIILFSPPITIYLLFVKLCTILNA